MRVDTWYVYALIEPVTGAPRYVGCTGAPAKRLLMHISEHASPAVAAWVRGFSDAPEIRLLASRDNREAALALERSAIELFSGAGFSLLNESPGTKRLRKFSSEPLTPRGIGSRVADLRHKKGMSVSRLAKLTGHTNQSLQNLEFGSCGFSVVHYFMIAQALGTTVEFLVTGSDHGIHGESDA